MREKGAKGACGVADMNDSGNPIMTKRKKKDS